MATCQKIVKNYQNSAKKLAKAAKSAKVSLNICSNYWQFSLKTAIIAKLFWDFISSNENFLPTEQGIRENGRQGQSVVLDS